jgi:acid phosphatase
MGSFADGVVVCFVISALVLLASCAELGLGTRIVDNGHILMKTSCSSFFYNSQVNNLQGWLEVPEECEGMVAHYMNHGQYDVDADGVVTAMADYLSDVVPQGDGMDVVIFDIDETALSNLPYYQQHRYGCERFVHAIFSEWVEEGIAPVIASVLRLYKELQAGKWGVILMTGRMERQRNITTQNLLAAGYDSWTSLILRSPEDEGTPAAAYKIKKRLELQEKGYRIWASLGDQWSDLTGPAAGNRTFKLPNPMYFIA